jgi:hypothetical protein
LKPLLFEREFSADSLYLQRRIGAFEVQIMHKLSQKTEQSILYSKLKSKAWPNLRSIVSQIPSYLTKVNLLIQLTFDDYRKKQREPIEGELKNIQAVLTAVRDIGDETRQKRTRSQDSRLNASACDNRSGRAARSQSSLG